MASRHPTNQNTPQKDSQAGKQSGYVNDLHNLPVTRVKSTIIDTDLVLKKGQFFYYHYSVTFGLPRNKYGLCSLLKENVKYHMVMFDELKVKTLDFNNKYYRFYSELSAIKIDERDYFISGVASISEKTVENLIPHILQRDWKSQLNTSFISKEAFLHHLISLSANVAMIKSLINSEIDWSWKDSEGNSFIHAACLLEKNDDIAEGIINNMLGTNPNALNFRNQHNQTPLDLILSKNNPNAHILVHLFRKGGSFFVPENDVNRLISNKCIVSCLQDDKSNTGQLIIAYEIVKPSFFNKQTFFYSQINDPKECGAIQGDKLQNGSNLIQRIIQQFDVLIKTNCPQIFEYVFDPQNNLLSESDRNSQLHLVVKESTPVILQHFLTNVNWSIEDRKCNILQSAILSENFPNLIILINKIPIEALKSLMFSHNLQNMVPSQMMINDKRAFEGLLIAIDKSCVDEFGNNFIHIAVENGNFECLQYLLANTGKNFLIFKNNNSVTPLQLAITKSNAQSVDLLVQHSIEYLGHVDNFGCNCLHSSIIHYDNHIFKMVLSGILKFDMKAQNKLIDKTTRDLFKHNYYVNCPTPFLLSIQLNQLEASELLVSNGANIGKPDGKGRNVFDYLIEYCKKPDLIQKILTIKINERNLTGLERTVEIQDLEIKGCNILKYFYLHGDLNSFINCFETLSSQNKFRRDKDGNTILHIVLDRDDKEVVEFLLNKLSILSKTQIKDVINFINYKNNQGETALSQAVRKLLHSCAQQIIDLGPDITTKYRKDNTILHIALDTKDSEMIDILLKHPQIHTLYNEKNDNGQIPIIELMKIGKGDASKEISLGEGVSLLHYAVQVEDISIQTKLFNQIEISSQMKVKDKDGRTPFHYAIIHQNTNAIKTLSDHKADILYSDFTDKTAIHFAIEANTEEIWTQIFQRLRNYRHPKRIIDETMFEGVNLLQYSILRRNLAAVRDILTLKPNLCPPHPEENTIIHLAAQSIKSAEILAYLLNTIDTFDLNRMFQTANKRQLPPLHYAISCNNTEALKLLEQYGSQIAVPFKGKLSFFSPIFQDKLILCRLNSHPYVVKKLLFGYKVESTVETLLILTDVPQLTTTKIYHTKHVQEVNEVDEDEITTLLGVTSTDVIMYMISKHIIDVQTRFSNGSTLLHLAAKFGSCQILNLFFTKELSNASSDGNFDVFTLDGEHNSILYYALQSNNNEVLPLICNQISDCSKFKNWNSNFFDIPNSKGVRPLDMCLEMEKLTGFETLLSKKYEADLIYIDGGGLTLLHRIIESHSSEKFLIPFLNALNQRFDSSIIGRYLDCLTQEGFTALHLSVLRKKKEIFKLLLDLGPNLDLRTSQGYNALHLIASINELSLLNTLMEYFKDYFLFLVDSQMNDSLLTPLHIASLNEYFDIVRILLENSANPNIQDSEGKTALHYVTMLPNKSEKTKKMIETFLIFKSSMAVRDNFGRTPLFYAVMEQNIIALKAFTTQDVQFLDTDNENKTIIHYSIDLKQNLCWNLLFSKFKGEIIKGNFTNFSLFEYLQYCMSRNNVTAFTDLLNLTGAFKISDKIWVELIAASIGPNCDCIFLRKLISHLKVQFSVYIDRLFCPKHLDFTPPLQLAVKNANIPAIRVLIDEKIPLAFPTEGNQITLNSEKNPEALVVCRHIQQSKDLIGYKIQSSATISSYLLVTLPDLANTELYESNTVSEEKKLTMDCVVKLLKCQSIEPIISQMEKIKLSLDLNILNLAAEHGSTLVLKYLLSIQDMTKLNLLNQILFCAIQSQNTDSFGTVCNFLFEKQAFHIFNATNDCGKRIIEVCIEKDDFSNFSFLLESKFQLEINFSDDKGYTMFHKLVLLKKDLKFIKKLHTTFHSRYNEKIFINKAAGQSQLTAFHLAILENQPDLIEFMLLGRYNKRSQTKCGNTSLHLAILCNFLPPEITKSILESDPLLINARNKNGYTPLHFAIQNANTGIINLLIDKGADINLCDNLDRSVLHHAVLLTDINLISEINSLLTRKPDLIYMKDKSGQTALHYSVNNKNSEALKILLAKSSYMILFEKDQNKKTILHYAIQNLTINIWNTIFEKLRKFKNNSKSYEKSIEPLLLMHSIQHNNLATFQDILSLNPDLNAYNDGGNTLLHLAAMSPETIQILDSLLHYVTEHIPEKRQDILCSQNNDHLAPFHLAIFHNNTAAIDIFLKYNVPFVFHDKLSRQLTICSKDSPLTLSLCEDIKKHLLYIGYKVLQGPPNKVFWILVQVPSLEFEPIKYNSQDIREVRISESYIQYILKCPTPEPIVTFIKSGLIPEMFKFPNKCTILHFAARFGSIEVVSELSKTIQIEGIYQNDETVLFYALENPNIEILNFLLTKITSENFLQNIANKESISDKRVLEVAIDKDHFEGFECLLKRKFQIELIYKDTNGLTLLHKIIQNRKDTKFLNALLNEIKARNPENLPDYINSPKHGTYETALHLCLSGKQTDMLKILLSYSPNFSCEDSEGNTPLHYAIIHNVGIDLVVNSIKKLDGDNLSLINAVNKEQLTPIHFAVTNRDLSSVKLLLTENANLYVIDQDKRSLLHLSVNIQDENSRDNMIKFLLEYEQDHPNPDNCLLHMQDNGGYTALHIAVRNSLTSTIKLLIQYKPDPMMKDNQGATVLHLSVHNDIPEIVAVLIEYNERMINVQDSEGNSPLHLAISLNKEHSLQLLLNNNPSLDLKNALGLTPLHLAVLHHVSVFDQVWKAIEDKIKSSNDLKMCHFLGALNNEGLPPLHYAILNTTKVDLINKLKDKEAKLCFTDNTGEVTLFHGKDYLDLCIVKKQAKHTKYVPGFVTKIGAALNIASYNWFVGYKCKNISIWVLTELPMMDTISIESDSDIEDVITRLKYDEDVLVDIVKCKSTDPIKVAIDKKLVDNHEKENKSLKLLKFATKQKGSSHVIRYIRGSDLTLDETCSWIEDSFEHVDSLQLIFETIPNYNYGTIIEDSSELTGEELKRNKLAIALSNALLYSLDNESVEPLCILLSHKICLNRQYGDYKNTLLHVIINKCKSEHFLVLLLNKVKEFDGEEVKVNGEPLIDAKNSKSETALTLCIIHNQEKNLEMLLNFKPTMTLKDKSDNNILHHVAKTGNTVIAEIIFRSPNDLESLFNAPNSDGCIPLHLAVENGNESITKMLLDNKSNFYSQDKVYRTVLHHPILNQNEAIQSSMIKYILEYERANFPSASKQIFEFEDIEGHIPLSYAIRHSSLTAVQLLVSYAFTLKHRDQKGQTALHLASAHGNADIFNEIIGQISLQESGSESESWLNDRVICYQDEQGRTALHVCIEHNNNYALKMLLEKKPCLNLTDYDGNSLLHYTVCNKQETIALETLIKELKNRFTDLGTYYYCTNSEGIPTLHFAIQNDNISAVNVLLKEGIQLAFRQNNGNFTLCHKRSKLNLSILQHKNNKTEVYAGYWIQTKWVVTRLPDMNKTDLKLNEIKQLDNANLLNKESVKPLLLCHSYEPLEAISKLLHITLKIGNESLIQFVGRYSTVEVMGFFIESFKIDVFEPHKTSLLESAVRYNPDIETVKTILKWLPHIDNLNIPEKNLPEFNKDHLISLCLYNSLEYSINRKDTEIFEELLRFGAKLDNPYGSDEGTILHLMINLNSANFVECLLKWVKNSRSENKEVFVSGIPFIDAPNNRRETALLLFTNKQLQSHLEVILKYSPNMSITDSEGNNALHLAALRNNFALFKLLVNYALETECKSLIEEKNLEGLTPLFIAIDKMNIEITEHLLINCDSSIFPTDTNKRNVLHHVVLLVNSDKRSRFITLILKRENAIPNLTRGQDEEGKTPLHLAIIKQYEETVNELLKADPFALTLIDTDKRTALHYAARGRNTSIVKLLVDTIQHEEESSHDLVWLQDRIICRQDFELKTALHLCIENGNDETLTLLLDTKPCLDLKDKDGNSLLHCAVFNPRNEKSIGILLKVLNERFPEAMSEYLYAENSDGTPSLQYAISKNHLKGAGKLIEYKANLAFYPKPQCYTLCHGKNGLNIEFLQKEIRPTGTTRAWEYFVGMKVARNVYVACLLPELKITEVMKTPTVIEKYSWGFLLSILQTQSIEPFIAALNSGYNYFTLGVKFKDGRYFKHIIAQHASREVTAHFLTLFHEPVYLYGDGNKSMIEYAVLNKRDPSTLQLLLQKVEVCDNVTIGQEEKKNSIEFCVKKAFESSLESNDTSAAFENLLTFVSRIDYRYDDDNTLLHLVVKKTKTPAFINLLFTKVKEMKSPLIDGVPFIDVQNSHMKTALYICIEMKQKEKFETLLKFSPDLTKQDLIIKENVLHLAVFKDLFEFVEIILQNQSAQEIVNSQNCNGLSPLHFAVKNGDINMTDLLLNHKADFVITDNYDRTILHHAVVIDDHSKQRAMIKFILDSNRAPQNTCDILTEKKDQMGYTPLLLSVIMQSIDAFNLLFEFDSQSLFHKNLNGHTPLHLSIIPRECIMTESDPFHQTNNPKFHKELFENICEKINSQNKHEPLVPCHSNNIICSQDIKQRTAMHYAIQYKNIQAFKKLLETGSCLDIPDDEGNALLHEAVKDPDDISCLELLTKELKKRYKDSHLACFKF